MRVQDQLIEVEIEKISVNPYQPRQQFLQQELEELAASIRTVGLIHPPIVRTLHHGYELVSGERRLRAAQLAGFSKIPVIVREHEERTSAEVALIENLQRFDLNPLEIAKALHQLMETFELNQEQLAARIGKKRSTIANYLRLLTLPELIQRSLIQDAISMGHAKAILSIEQKERQLILHERIIDDRLSVREAEALALQLQKENKKSENKEQSSIYIRQLEELLQHHFGTKVTFEGKEQSGRICITYYDLDDLERLLGMFGIKEIS